MTNNARIKNILPVMGILIMMMAVTSCAAVRRESRFIPDTWPRDRNDIARDYYISTGPIIKLSSSCEDENSALVGPIIFIPLPILPNPMWPFRYFSNRWEKADLVLSFEASRTMISLDKVTISVRVNGKLLTPTETLDDSSAWNDKRRYDYHPELTCGELEDSEIVVHIEGVPGTIDSKLFYTYRWTVHVDRM